MPDLKERLVEDMKKAMREKSKKELSVIRMARAAIKNKEINNQKELNNQEVIEVLSGQVKKIRESIEDFIKGDRTDAVEEAKNEIKILQRYLPEQMGENEINNLVDEIIEEVEATDMSDMGKVMKTIMPRVKGRVDGSEVNRIVREKLQ